MSMDDDDMEVTVQFLNTGFDFLSMGEMETRMTKEELLWIFWNVWDSIILFITISWSTRPMCASG